MRHCPKSAISVYSAAVKRIPALATLVPSISMQKPTLRGVSHKLAFLVSLPMGALLMFLADSRYAVLAAAIYAASLSALLCTSAAYHRINWTPKARAWMRRLDHTMIFVLIAGTYTPFAMLKLDERLGLIVLISLWSAVGAGIVLKLVWLSAPKWLVAVLYVATGWMSVWVAPEMVASTGVLCVTLIGVGGALYTIGALVYAMKRPNPRPGIFGYHEVFHALVIAAAFIHYIAIAVYVLPA